MRSGDRGMSLRKTISGACRALADQRRPRDRFLEADPHPDLNDLQAPLRRTCAPHHTLVSCIFVADHGGARILQPGDLMIRCSRPRIKAPHQWAPHRQSSVRRKRVTAELCDTIERMIQSSGIEWHRPAMHISGGPSGRVAPFSRRDCAQRQAAPRNGDWIKRLHRLWAA